MIYLIIGAAFQGKRAYAEQQYRRLTGREPSVGDGWQMELADSLDWPIVDHLTEMLYRLPEDDDQYQAATDAWLARLTAGQEQDSPALRIVVLDEIGAGLVPLTAGDRLWRERCGRLGCRLAELAERVDRIWCGLPVVLKENGRVTGAVPPAVRS